jgi:hypothetical protein
MFNNITVDSKLVGYGVLGLLWCLGASAIIASAQKREVSINQSGLRIGTIKDEN